MNGKVLSQRQLQVGELVRYALVSFLQRGELYDERTGGSFITVSQVVMSPDLKIATVYICDPMSGGNNKLTAKILAENAKLLRGKITPHLRQMKYIPQLRFRADVGFDNFAKIDALLKDDAKKAE